MLIDFKELFSKRKPEIKREKKINIDTILISSRKKLIRKVAPPQRPRRSSRFRLASACQGFGKKNSTLTGAKGTAAKPFDGNALTARRTRGRRRERQRCMIRLRPSGAEEALPCLSLSLLKWRWKKKIKGEMKTEGHARGTVASGCRRRRPDLAHRWPLAPAAETDQRTGSALSATGSRGRREGENNRKGKKQRKVNKTE